MQQTTNFQLNQWDAEDRILRTDFNSDNAKLDAALKTQSDALAAEAAVRESSASAETAARQKEDAALEKRFSLREISSSTLTETVGRQLRFSFKDFDWSVWKCIHCLVNPRQNSEGVYTLYLNFNAAFRVAANLTGALHLILWPLQDKENFVTGICFSSSSPGFCFPALSFQELESVDIQLFSTTVAFTAGTTLRLCGEHG